MSRAALYELGRLRAEHPDLIVRDLSGVFDGGAALIREDGPPIDRLYLLSAPDTYGTLFGAFAPQRLRSAHRAGLWVWETPIFPHAWRFAIGLVDEVWTPSEYCRQAIAPAVGTTPVSVRPHAVRPDTGDLFDRRWRHDLRRRFGIPDDAFFGLSIMDISCCPARKNPWAHVAAWQCAFGDDPRHILLLKLRMSKRTRVVLDELRAMVGGGGNVRLLEAELPAGDIVGLQGACDVYLSLHRAEGYGLNIHECLALRTPVIATDFSANAEYGPRFQSYRPVPYRLVPYRDWTGYYPDRRFEWAEADIAAAAAELRGVAYASGR